MAVDIQSFFVCCCFNESCKNYEADNERGRA